MTASIPGFRRVTQTVDVAADASKQLDFSLDAALSEEITVTAMKREQTLLDVPFSVAAPTEEVLRDRGVEDIEGVAANVGGFTVQNLGPGQSQVAMRGVSAGQIVRDQPGVKEQVGVYLDESVISLSLFTPDLDLFDMNRVEVLRGPQGTLFGSGSLSGTVRYITNQPELNVTRAFAELGGGGVDGGSLGGNAKFGFNVPLGDKAALRVASYLQPPRRVHRRRAARRERQGERQRRLQDGRARGGQDRAERPPVHHAADRLPERRKRTAGTASTRSTSSPIPSRRRGRR